MARSLLDRALSGLGLQRMSTDGGFRASRTGRLSNPFETERRHINSAIAAGGSALRARSRFHCREGGLLVAAKETWVAYAIGTGLTPTWPDVRPTARRALHKAFNRWAKRCDFDGRTTYFGLQALVSGEVFEAGEVFVRFVRSEHRPLRLQIIASEQLPYDCWATQAEVGNEVRLGIEFNPAGERVAYHFYREHPGDGTKQATAQVMERVLAEDILHIYRLDQPGQLRGIPRTKAALIPANKSNDYQDALLERANVGSAFAVAITKERSEDPGGDGQQAEMVLEPGVIFDLEPGEKVETIDPPDPGGNFDAFVFSQNTRACASMGVPYAETTGDLRRSNYSSTRAGRQPFKRKVTQDQNFCTVPQFCDPVVIAWLADALLRGDITLPRGASRALSAYDNIDHVPDIWEYVDPKADAAADVLLVDNLMKSRSRVAAERGEDPVELDEVIRDEQAREQKLGLRRGKTAQVDGPEDDPDSRSDADEDDAVDEDDKETTK